MFPDISYDFIGYDLQQIEVNSFAERSTLPNDNDITFLDWEGRWTVHGYIPMSFFISVIFRHIVEIVPSHNYGSLHFCGNNDTFQYLAPNWYAACEGTFLIDILRFDCLFGCLESKSNILEVSNTWGCLLGE